MASETAFNMLCTDLGFLPASVPESVGDLLKLKLDAAAAELSDAGIAVDETVPQDLELLVLYAAWLYRGRVQQSAKPWQLQRLIRNRQAAKLETPEPEGGVP